MRENLRIFPFGQYIVGNVVFLAFCRRISWFKIEMGVEKKCTKMLTLFPVDFPHTPVTPQHAVIIDDVIVIGSTVSLAGVYCASTLLGRRVCKRVDVYIITLSCSWRIYALFERLLVVAVSLASSYVALNFYL